MSKLTNSPNWMYCKRYGFLQGFLPLALPIGAWYRMETTDSGIFAWLPLVIIFGMFPFVGRWMANDLNNFEGDVIFSLGEDPCDSSLLVVVAPLQLALIFWGVGVFVNGSLGLWGSLGWILSMGVVLSTVGITVGHELVHHKSRFEQACGGILLASVQWKLQNRTCARTSSVCCDPNRCLLGPNGSQCLSANSPRNN